MTSGVFANTPTVGIVAVLSDEFVVDQVATAEVCVILITCRFKRALLVGGMVMIGGSAATGVALSLAPDETLPPASIAKMV